MAFFAKLHPSRNKQKKKVYTFIDKKTYLAPMQQTRMLGHDLLLLYIVMLNIITYMHMKQVAADLHTGSTYLWVHLAH